MDGMSSHTLPPARRAARTRARRAHLALAPLLSVGLLLTACGDDADGEDPETSESPSASPTPTEEPTAEPTEEPTEPTSTGLVYYVVDTRAGLRLAREPRELTGDPATAAVETMIAGPADPDYTSAWDTGTQVLGVEEADGTVTVDLSSEARDAEVGSPGAEIMVQQLVWTVTEAVGADASVQLTIDGEPAGELWGSVSWDEPLTRGDADSLRLMVQIDSPAEGATVSTPLLVEGEANAFEANVPWEVLDESGQVVEEGFTTAAEGMTFAPFSFSVELEPGTYTVVVREDDPSGGEGGQPMSDSRTVTVE